MLHLVVPAGVDDPARPSGGNRYDRRLCHELRAAGRAVCEHPGDDLAVLDRTPDGTAVLVDGLVASACPAEFVRAAGRLRLGVLVHMLTGGVAERAVLCAADPVITTSSWGRDRVIAEHGVHPEHVHVARPGADRAPLAPGTADGGSLLCVGVVAPHKGQDVLLAALAQLTALPWRLTCVGSVGHDPGFVARLRAHVDTDRVAFRGPLSAPDLEAAYAAADVLVHPSRGEMYGLVLTEALAHGLPVIATRVGGVTEAVGSGGTLVPPDDPAAFAGAVRGWLTSADRRAALRRDAALRRRSLRTWSETAHAVAEAVGL